MIYCLSSKLPKPTQLGSYSNFVQKNKIPTTLTTTNQQHSARQHRERQETQTHHRNFMASACWRAQLLLKEKILFKLLIIYSLCRLSCTKFE